MKLFGYVQIIYERALKKGRFFFFLSLYIIGTDTYKYLKWSRAIDCSALYPLNKLRKPVQEEPARPDPSEAVEEPEGSQSKQAFEKPLTLNYHKVEKPERKPTVLEWPPQVATNSVVTWCLVHVKVKQDLLGIGRLIQPQRITLGGCPATEEDTDAHVITFESELHGCGSELTMTEDVLIYTFTLV
ncbi:unnamed protein product [Oncorhynchus mykiss]|uniref:ZP domain-containing protein n=1 Tax=Oncorhynchus mykiss TaxID=8022 RepID=A0A060XAX7_ONCMY|nr:unnamed protein product [Oncorhynchus mykiss]